MNKKNIALVISILLISLQTLPSSTFVDSLEKALPNADKYEKLKIYILLDSAYVMQNPGKAIYYSEKAIILSKELNAKLEESNALMHAAKAFEITSDRDKALEYLKKSLLIKEKLKDIQGIASIYNITANIYQQQGDSKKALDYHNKALKIREEIKDSLGIASSLNNIGIIYKNRGLLEKALGYYHKSLKISEKLNSLDIIGSTLTNIGTIYLELKRFKEAQENYLKALEIRKKINDNVGVSSSLIDLGNVLAGLGQYDSAIEYDNNSLILAERTNNNRILSHNLNNIGEVFFKSQKYDSAIYYYTKSLKLGEKFNDVSIIAATSLNLADTYLKMNQLNKVLEPLNLALKISLETRNNYYLVDVYKSFSEYYKKVKIYDKSLEYKEMFINLKDSLFNYNMMRTIHFMQLSFDIEKKNQELTILKKDNVILEKENQNQRTITASIIVVLILSILLVILLYNRYLSKKKANILLTQKNLEINQQRSELESAKESLTLLNEDKDKYLSIIENDLIRAAKYIESLLPKPITTGEIQTEWIFKPSSKLGGDAFGYHWLDDENFALYLFDVSGHGVGACLHSVSILNTLKYRNLRYTDFKNPENVLSGLNSIYQMKDHNNLFFTIWYGVFNIKNKELIYATAGHPPAILLNENDYDTLSSKNQFIGTTCINGFNSERIKIKNNSTLILYSDGVFEIISDYQTLWDLDSYVEFVVKDYNNSDKSLDYILNKSIELSLLL